MSTKLNGLQRLAQQFEALPRQKELRQTKFQFATIANRVNECATELSETLGQLEILRDVQSKPRLLKAEVAEQLKFLRSPTQSLESIARSGEGQTQRITVALDTLANLARGMSTVVSEAWRAANDEVIAGTEALVSLTGTYDPNAQRALQRGLDEFRSLRAPSKPESVAAYIKAREVLLNTRLNLQVPGVAGKFLMDALQGVGSVKMLSDPQVQAFLEKHPVLWTRLLVKLV